MDYVIEHINTTSRAKGIILDDRITIYSPLDSFSIVAIAFIKRMAKYHLSIICEENAKKIKQTINRIGVRDTTRQ